MTLDIDLSLGSVSEALLAMFNRAPFLSHDSSAMEPQDLAYKVETTGKKGLLFSQ
ncbi:hypothetical protein BGZ70_001268, partial [Mortierella alpina]